MAIIIALAHSDKELHGSRFFRRLARSRADLIIVRASTAVVAAHRERERESLVARIPLVERVTIAHATRERERDEVIPDKDRSCALASTVYVCRTRSACDRCRARRALGG